MWFIESDHVTTRLGVIANTGNDDLDRGLRTVEEVVRTADFQKFDIGVASNEIPQIVEIGAVVHRRGHDIGELSAGPKKLEATLEEEGKDVDATGNDLSKLSADCGRSTELKVRRIADDEVERRPGTRIECRSMFETGAGNDTPSDGQDGGVDIPTVDLGVWLSVEDGREELPSADAWIEDAHPRSQIALRQEALPKGARGHVLAEGLAIGDLD